MNGHTVIIVQFCGPCNNTAGRSRVELTDRENSRIELEVLVLCAYLPLTSVPKPSTITIQGSEIVSKVSKPN